MRSRVLSFATLRNRTLGTHIACMLTQWIWLDLGLEVLLLPGQFHYAR